MSMDVRFERSTTPTDEWYTPQEIIDALGRFDLDPCAPVSPLWETADVMYNKNDNGLTKDWFGRVWLNPPYSRPLIELFVRRLAEHGDGIALLFNRCDNKLFQDIVFEQATALKFLRNRIRFSARTERVGAVRDVEVSSLRSENTMQRCYQYAIFRGNT